MESREIVLIEGDGVGKEISSSMTKVVDEAVKAAYKGKRRLSFIKAEAGVVSLEKYGATLTDDVLSLIKKHKVAIKGPLMTPVGRGIRSVNVELRQKLDLFVCQRPVEYFEGVPSPIKRPENVNMVVFRENTEDIYAGIEWSAGSDGAKKVIEFLKRDMGVDKIRFPETSAIGIKPVSEEGSKRLIKAAIDFAIKEHRRNVTFVHKGNIMKFTEGGFLNWGNELSKEKYGAYERDGRLYIPRTGESDLEIKSCIADAFLQNIILKSEEYDVIATLNLNGDYISDALSALVGGIGIAPGANINTSTGVAVFEATHGTAPDIAGKGIVNPLSIILSAAMMLDYIGYGEAATLIKSAVRTVLKNGFVTKDLYDTMLKNSQKGVLLSTEEFTETLISNLV